MSVEEVFVQPMLALLVFYAQPFSLEDDVYNVKSAPNIERRKGDNKIISILSV